MGAQLPKSGMFGPPCIDHVSAFADMVEPLTRCLPIIKICVPAPRESWRCVWCDRCVQSGVDLLWCWCRFLLCVLHGGAYCESSSSPPPAPSTVPECAEALQRLCKGAKGASKGNCFVCISTHQSKLQQTGCIESDFDAFC
jgi:hypothetical protein